MIRFTQELGERGAVYNIRGEFSLSSLMSSLMLDAARAQTPVQRVPYSEWYAAAQQWCRDDATHPCAISTASYLPPNPAGMF